MAGRRVVPYARTLWRLGAYPAGKIPQGAANSFEWSASCGPRVGPLFAKMPENAGSGPAAGPLLAKTPSNASGGPSLGPLPALEYGCSVVAGYDLCEIGEVRVI